MFDNDTTLFMARRVEEKGPHRAIRVAQAVRRPLVLAGPVQPGHERFFAKEREPHMDGQLIRYVGEVGGVRKHRLFADAFLMPIRWPEPFGLVMVEALAVGTPVLAFARGAAPEIIEHGVNGFLCRDQQEMATLVESAARIDPVRCRQTAEWVAPDRIAAAYELVYREALARACGGCRAAREPDGAAAARDREPGRRANGTATGASAA